MMALLLLLGWLLGSFSTTMYHFIHEEEGRMDLWSVAVRVTFMVDESVGVLSLTLLLITPSPVTTRELATADSDRMSPRVPSRVLAHVDGQQRIGQHRQARSRRLSRLSARALVRYGGVPGSTGGRIPSSGHGRRRRGQHSHGHVVTHTR